VAAQSRKTEPKVLGFSRYNYIRKNLFGEYDARRTERPLAAFGALQIPT
jgi:hypothetical protein